MKTIIWTLLIAFAALISANMPTPPSVVGAWKQVGNQDGLTTVTIFSKGQFATSVFDVANKKFVETYGGTYKVEGNTLTQTFEFYTSDSTKVGTSQALTVSQKGKNLVTKAAGSKAKVVWQPIDDSANAPLAGAWRITGREGQNGEIAVIRKGPRRTIKIMSGTRFQWTAYNVETKQFSGCGGGTYILKDGQYTETIEYFLGMRAAWACRSRLGPK